MTPRRARAFGLVLFLIIGAACGSSGDDKKTVAPATAPSDVGRVTFIGADRKLYRVEARAKGRVEDISARLDTLSRKGEDNYITSSADGQWLLVDTERFDQGCSEWACAAIVAGDLSSGESVRINGTNGELLHTSQPAALGPNGKTIVYPSEGKDGHDLDLFATTLTNGLWSVPARLTAASPHKFNRDPVISDDGSKVLFSCGTEQYGDSDTAICEVHLDASAFRVVLDPAKRPAGITEAWSFRSPRYEPDGSIVFVASLGSQLWRIAPGAPEPTRISPADGDASSVCVLPDGRLVTSWGGQPGFKDYTLIMRVTSRSATSPVLPAPKTAVTPGQFGCSR